MTYKAISFTSKDLVLAVICLLSVLLMAGRAAACETCGCSSSASSFGLAPDLSSHNLGILYSYRSFDGGFIGDPEPSFDAFRTVGLRASFVPADGFQVIGFLPYQFNSRTINSESYLNQGLGDASLIGRYTLIGGTKDSLSVRHRFVVGAGIKMPTGKFRQEQDNDGALQPPNYQLGTASWDIYYELMYIVRFEQLAIQTNALYRQNTANKFAYRFGNQISASLNLNYSIKQDDWLILPYAGLAGEQLWRDSRRDIFQNQTGGHALNVISGLNVFYGKTGLTTRFQAPLAQQYANGEIRSNTMWEIGITTLF